MSRLPSDDWLERGSTAVPGTSDSNRDSSQKFPVMSPHLQISFFNRLETFCPLYLAPARERTVAALDDITLLDRELADYVGADRLQLIARFGLRGEVFFPVPLILRKNPQLLGYYRLLYGFSQKEFYNRRAAPFAPFAAMEMRGVIPRDRDGDLSDLCRSLIETGTLLIEGFDQVNATMVHELQLLTVGPLFRGSRNTDLGKAAVGLVFNLIRSMILPSAIQELNEQEIRITNAAGRLVRIRFSSDPDIAVSEFVGRTERRRLAIEVKGGTDVSNRLNRLGEAEKSHLKAQSKGFTEFWTIAATEAAESEVRANSPTTTVYFLLREISEFGTPGYEAFKEQLSAALGIPITSPSEHI
jgi:hypothetical protein